MSLTLTRTGYASSVSAVVRVLTYAFPFTSPPLLPGSQTSAQHGTYLNDCYIHSAANRAKLQSIMEYNGGSVIAMVGKECVAIASDLRLGNQALGISSNFQKVRQTQTMLQPLLILSQIFPMSDRIYLGLPGLATDVTTLYAAPLRVHADCTYHVTPHRKEIFRYRVNMYTIKEEREIEPETFAHLVSSTLYEKRFGPYFIEPVMAGLEKTASGGYKPFIAATDLIGCLNFAKDFVVAGTASTKLFGVAEGLWEPDLEPEDLFETCAQTLLNAVDRDAYSGWGAEVYLMCVYAVSALMVMLTLYDSTKDKVVKRTLKGRMD